MRGGTPYTQLGDEDQTSTMHTLKVTFFSKLQEMGWRLGLRPRTRWGSLQRSPRPPSWIPPPPPPRSQLPRSASEGGNFVTQCCSRVLYCATIRLAMDITKECTNCSGITEGEEELFCRIKNDRVAFRRSVTENREKGKTYNNTGP